ncbi:MAG: putative ABC transporter permease [Hungatella sp.]|nr:putative ABC transporter permease [Hungatella sp.]
MTSYEILWLFLAGSFSGWVLETVLAALKRKRFVNRGLVNGPFCVLYGIVLVILTVVCKELTGFWLFIGAAILATVAEWVAGHLLEWMYHEKWWDYSKNRWNLDGYICFSMSVLWGVLGMAALKWGNSLWLKAFHLIPKPFGKGIVWCLAVCLVIDILATVIILSGKERKTQSWEKIDFWFAEVSRRLGQRVYRLVNRRIENAYPKRLAEKARARAKKGFASGCSFYKVVWLFFIGAFLGDITETIFCRITAGVWMSRSSVVWGPFSIVWGLAVALVTVLLYKYRDKSDRFLFFMGTALGGAYEYLCSVFTELVFGTIFWDYSEIPFNLGGRINLLYCFFWGIAAVVWFKGIYPVIASRIERIPKKAGTIVTWIMLLFMSCNIFVSAMALIRKDERSRGVPAQYSWQERMDERFGDQRMERIYPNAVKVSPSLQ